MPLRSVPRRILSALAAGVLIASVTPAGPAAGASTTECVGTIESRAIVGDLVVPAGWWCTLRKVSVTGSVTVGQDSVLNTESVTIQSALTIHTGAQVVTRWTTVRGSVSLDQVNAVGIRSTTVLGSVVGSAAHLDVADAQVNGRVAIARRDDIDVESDVTVLRSGIGQGLRVDGLSTYVLDSQVGKYLVVDQTILGAAPTFPGGAWICSTSVAGDLTLKSVRSPRVGVPGPGTYCLGAPSQPVDVLGSLLLLASTGQRAVLDGRFGKDLVCRNNSLLPLSGPGGVVAGGQYIQQCARFRPV